ncbi:hypothetical protein HOLleu_31375 [Holothuria leucospilota]|uniref:Uncharacterized protein n=1 Tax=Holothuria leucospilota TaxID=206669 RepID=A0A9Q1BHA0_HOLLE|nr:hypothetical protein HOLleu_31375 [Holothuria leucospilota]
MGSRAARKRRNRLNGLLDMCATGGSPEVERLMVAECRGAFIRSRERVLGVGERMSGFFHCQEKKRAVSRDITAIRDFSGKTVEGDDILPVFHEFYSKLYAKDTAVSEEIQILF